MIEQNDHIKQDWQKKSWQSSTGIYRSIPLLPKDINLTFQGIDQIIQTFQFHGPLARGHTLIWCSLAQEVNITGGWPFLHMLHTNT